MSKTVDDIVEDILAKFKELRKQRDDIDMLPPRWIELVYSSKFSPEERGNLTLAIEQLVAGGLIINALEYAHNSLILTKAGRDRTYR